MFTYKKCASNSSNGWNFKIKAYSLNHLCKNKFSKKRLLQLWRYRIFPNGLHFIGAPCILPYIDLHHIYGSYPHNPRLHRTSAHSLLQLSLLLIP